MARMLRQLWLWMTGRYHRFGYAAVNFGRPLSLAEFTAAQPPGGQGADDLPEPLSQELMERIGEIVPVLPVPAVAWLLQSEGAMSRSALEHRLGALLERMPMAHIHVPRHSHAYAVEAALRILIRRGIVRAERGRYQPVPAKRDLLVYYANSIRHLVPAASLTSDAASAKEISATARS
jgi:glycerol-3-phosphate O-acyltransferase